MEKAKVYLLDDSLQPKGDPIEVLFNPPEYSVERSNQFQNTQIPGLTAPVTHFVSGNAQSLTVDLLFDTYTYFTEKKLKVDVRDYTRQITDLLEINSELHAPPIVMFIWGTFHMNAIIERVSQKYTMFMDDGTPVRAALNVTFKEYKTVAEQFSKKPRHSSDRTKLRTMKDGDNLFLLAAREYGDPGMWRNIARKNNINNARNVKTGIDIVVPPLE